MGTPLNPKRCGQESPATAAGGSAQNIVQLKTRRLTLREFVPSDGAAVYAIQGHPAYAQFYPWEHISAEDSQQWVDEFISWQQQRPRLKYQFAVIATDSNVLIGNCGVRIDDAPHRQGNMGYEIHPDHWGQGYASEAAAAMVRFAFEDLHLHRLWALCVSTNIASWKILEKLNMRREGHFRERAFFKGQWHDHYHYGLLESEWQQHQQQFAPLCRMVESTWKDIPTSQLGQIHRQLQALGWQISYAYEGIDAGIDYSEFHFAHNGITLKLQWDPWDEGQLTGPAEHLAALKALLNPQKAN